MLTRFPQAREGLGVSWEVHPAPAHSFLGQANGRGLPFHLSRGPPIIPKTSARTFARTARTFRSSPRKAMLVPEGPSPELGLEKASVPGAKALQTRAGYSPARSCTYGDTRRGDNVRPHSQEQTDKGTSPGFPTLTPCCHGCSWEEALSVTCCSLSE